MIVASIAEADECIVVTVNERDFASVETPNPVPGVQ